MKHKQAWTIAVLFLLVGALTILLGGWQINNGSGGGSSIGVGLTLRGQCAGTAVSAGTTSVLPMGLQTNSSGTCGTATTPTLAATNGIVISHACTLKNLLLVATAAGSNASDSVVTVYLGNAGSVRTSTGITCTLGTALSCTDTTHTAAATQGQTVTVGIVTQTSSSAAGYSLSVDCQ